MLRFYIGFFGALVTALPFTSAAAEELAKADSAPVITAQASEPNATATPQNLYMVCAFYPKPGACEDVYRHAMRDNSISAQAVRAEYAGYARYLNGAATLNEADRQFLKDSGIRAPQNLSPANQAGLHNVINDPSLSGDAKHAAVNNFLSRAVEAELYCGFNNCEVPARAQVGANNPGGG